MTRRVNKLLVGPPGTGKTATTKAKYAYTEVVLLSAATEDDISGLPYLEAGKERRTQPHWLERLLAAAGSLQAGERACLFLDELDKARREVADTMLTLVASPERYGIPETVDIVAACNPPEWGGGDGISKPMLSRFSVLQFVPNVQDVCEYLHTKYPQAGDFIERLACGEIPIFDSVGEGYDLRITCPRTLDMALTARCAGEPDEVIAGLVTANVAHCLLDMLSEKEINRDRKNVVLKSRQLGSKRIPVSV